MPARRPRTGPDLEDLVGDRHDRGVVLDDDDGVALVAQRREQAGEAVDVAGVQPGRRLVEDVEHVVEGAAEVADHRDALGLAAGEGRGLPVEAEVAQAEVDEPIELRRDLADDRAQGAELPAVHRRHEVAHLHRGGGGQREPFDVRRACGFVQAAAAALGARRLRDEPLVGGLRLALEPRRILAELEAPEADEHPLVVARQGVRAGRLDLAGLGVEQPMPLGGGVLLDRHVDVEEPAVGIPAPRERADLVLRMPERPFAQGAGLVQEGRDVEGHALPAALAGRAHAGGVVEGEGVGVADVWSRGARVEHPQPVTDVGDRRDRRAGTADDPALLDDDGGREVGDEVGLGARVGREVVLGKGAERRVDLALRLGCQRVEDERGLARPGHPDHDNELPLGEVEVEALEVVLARAAHADLVDAHASLATAHRASTDRIVGRWRATSCHVSPSSRLAKTEPVFVPT